MSDEQVKTTETDGDWESLDLDSYKDADKDQKIDFEVEGEEKEPVQAEASEPVVKEETTSKDEEDIPELEGIETEGAQKRIRQLVKQKKERDEALAAYKKEIEELKAAQSEIENAKFSTDEMLATATEEQLKQKLENARSVFKQAYSEGNQDALLEAQESISDTQTELKLLNQRKQWMQEQAEKRKQDLQAQQEQANNSNYDPKAHDWASRNPWFGQDQTATAVALAIDTQLKERGFDPSSDDYYKEVDRRLKEELPHKFGNATIEVEDTGSAVPSKPKQVVAGKSRSPAPKKVKLTQEDVALAKKWNIPLERYAAEKAKADKADGEYTSVL